MVHKTPLGQEVQSFDYHDRMDCYVLGTSQKLDFQLPEDEFHYEWNSEGNLIESNKLPLQQLIRLASDILLKPQIDQGSIKLLQDKTWTVVDT